MNGKDLLSGMSFVNSKYIDESENVAFPEKKILSIRRPFLLAAVIALLLCLVGCALVYVLSMQDVKIGEATSTRDYRLVNGTYVEDPHEVSESVLTLAGLKGSNAYQACADYFTFKEEYTKNMEGMMNEGTLPEDFFENDTYGKAMRAKADELAELYGLKPQGNILDFRTTRNMCDAIGVERFLQDSQDIAAVINGGGCYESGNFWLDIDFSFPEGMGYEVHSTFGVLRWNRTDCFSTDYVAIVDSGDWIERNYTTASGSEVLILQSPSQEQGYIICDRGDALMTLQLNMNRELLTEIDGVVSAEYQHMTDSQIELVADAIDFDIQPRIATQEDVDNQPGAPVSATQNGYTLTLKSVETDGYVVHILVGIAAPEGTDIESLDLGIGNHGCLAPVSGQMWGNSYISDITDNDGLSNTKDMLIVTSFDSDDDSIPCAAGSAWNLRIADLWVDKHYDTERLLVEGEWIFPITFDETNGDYREIELISEPIQAKACIGWSADGTDALEEFTVTSFKLRKFSSDIMWDLIPDYHGIQNFGESADFYGFQGHAAYVAMKDGTEIDLPLFGDAIDLDQVDHVVLADGTKLMMPKA